jgi:two-component system sensor histidine kinase KdpD
MPRGLEPDIGTFLKEMMAILASRTLSPAEKLHGGGLLVQRRLRSDCASVMLCDEERMELKVVAATRPEIVGMIQPVSQRSISAHVCARGEPLLIQDLGQDCRFSCRHSSYRTGSLMSVPLCSGDQVIGVINVSDKQDGAPFSESDLAVLLEYAGWITPLIENICFLDRLEQERQRYQDLAQELEIKQQELLLAWSRQREMVQMVVHDFKSPLSAVISNMDLLNYLGPREDQRPIIDTAFKGASSLLEMIDEFLHISRVDDCQESGFVPRSVSFTPLLRRQIDEVMPLVRDKNLRLENLCTEDVHVMGDPMLLGHLVQNLLSNAVKYTPNNGLIRVGMGTWNSRRAGDPSHKVLKFWVEDDGEGIEDRYKESIFEKFVRTDKSEESGIKGTGIGLFVCRKIASMFRGKIWVEDAIPRGSRFCVILFASEEHGYG